VLDLSWTDPRNSFAQNVGKREEISHSIRPGRDNDHSEGQHGEVVLFLQLAINRDEHVDSVRARSSRSPFLTPAQPRP